MFLHKNKIVITGGSGRFGTELKKIRNKYELLFPNKLAIIGGSGLYEIEGLS